MTTADAATNVSELEIFRHQARTIHTVVRLNTAGVTDEESLIQPSGEGNCLNWVVGHLLCIYGQTLRVLGQPSVMEESALERYARGAPPLHDPADAIDLGTMLSAWNEAVERIDTGLADLTPEVLDRPAPYSPGGNPDETIRSLLSVVLFHQAYHAGQLGLLRRIIGKEGAIR